jgi:hypothetical protein
MSSSSGDAHIRKWAAGLGTVPNHRLRAEFYHIQHEIAMVIMKEVVEETWMFYKGPVSRDDVRTCIALQRLDMKPITKLGCVLLDLDGWNDMAE